MDITQTKVRQNNAFDAAYAKKKAKNHLKSRKLQFTY